MQFTMGGCMGTRSRWKRCGVYCKHSWYMMRGVCNRCWLSPCLKLCWVVRCVAPSWMQAYLRNLAVEQRRTAYPIHATDQSAKYSKCARTRHTYIHTCKHACMHACMHACIHTYIHTCMHACMHTYIDTYTHTMFYKKVKKSSAFASLLSQGACASPCASSFHEILARVPFAQ